MDSEQNNISQTVITPNADQLQSLTRFERLSFALCDQFNRHPTALNLATVYRRNIGCRWVSECTANLTHLVGLEQIQSITAPRGLLLVANHRSFFDMYVITAWLYRYTNLLQHIFFPVRADFFYEHPAGVAVNFMMSVLAMYPPIFRQSEKRDFNNYSVKRIVQLLQSTENTVGIHPEGTRNKTDDPYTLLPAQPGIGKIIWQAQPTVIPIFVNGLINDFAGQIRHNFSRTGKPIIVTFGKPLELDGFYAKKNTLRTQMEISEFVREKITNLGSIERTLRADLMHRPHHHGPYLYEAPTTSNAFTG